MKKLIFIFLIVFNTVGAINASMVLYNQTQPIRDYSILIVMAIAHALVAITFGLLLIREYRLS